MIDWNKPVQTLDGFAVRILCTDAPNTYYPVIGLVKGSKATHYWNLLGEAGMTSGLSLINTPPVQPFYLNIEKDGCYTESEEASTSTSDVLVQIYIDPENKTIRVKSFNDTKINVYGDDQAKTGVVYSSAVNPTTLKEEGNLMGGYYQQISGKKSSIDLNSVELIEGDNE